MGIPRQHLQTLHPTGTEAARVWAPLSPTPAPPVTRSTPSAGPMETEAQALCLNVVIRELHLVRVLRLRNRGRNQERNQGRSLERNQERNQGRNQERSQERNPERSQERSQERGRNQTKVEQKQNLVVEFSFIG